MNTLQERVDKVQPQLADLLKANSVDITARAIIRTDGTIGAELMWIDTTPKEEAKADVVAPSDPSVPPAEAVVEGATTV